MSAIKDGLASCKVRDVYFPDPDELIATLHPNDIAQRCALDLTAAGWQHPRTAGDTPRAIR